MSKVYGYMRVSTDKQNDARQRVELLRHGVLPHNIFSDKASGKDFHRPQYAKLIKRLNDGRKFPVKSRYSRQKNSVHSPHYAIK